MPIQLKIIGALIIIIGSFSTGWAVKGAFVAKEQLAILEAKNELINDFRAVESNVAATLESKLSQLKANERVINNEVIKIVNRDVYHNECIDADGLRLIEAARTGQTNSTESTDKVQ